MKSHQKPHLKVIPLGGLEQIGMNMTAFEYRDTIIVVDCGLAFPEDDGDVVQRILDKGIRLVGFADLSNLYHDESLPVECVEMVHLCE